MTIGGPDTAAEQSQNDILYIGIDLGTSQSSIATSTGTQRTGTRSTGTGRRENRKESTGKPARRSPCSTRRLRLQAPRCRRRPVRRRRSCPSRRRLRHRWHRLHPAACTPAGSAAASRRSLRRSGRRGPRRHGGGGCRWRCSIFRQQGRTFCAGRRPSKTRTWKV